MMLLNTLLLAGECFFGGSLILALAFLLARGTSGSKAHLIYTGAFAAMLALPILAAVLPSQMVWFLPAAQPVTATPVMVAAVPATLPAAAAPVRHGLDLASMVMVLIALWAMGVIFVLSKALYGAVVLAGLHRQSVPFIPDGILPERFRGLSWQLRIRTVPGEAGPITFGLFRAVVLLPKTAVTWPRQRLEAVLLHEAAHVRRKDCLSRLIAVLACALYWPNPLVWVASNAMRREGETAADDCVLCTGMKASAYAEHLVGLARAFANAHHSHAGLSLAMAEPSMLDARVEAILNGARDRKGVSRAEILKIALLGSAAVAVIALARPVLAEAPQPSQAVAAQTSHMVKKTVVAREDSDADDSDDGDDDQDTRSAVAVSDVPQPPEAPVPATPATPATSAMPPVPARPATPAAPAAPPKPPHHIALHWHDGQNNKSWTWDVKEFDAQTQAEMKRAAAEMKADQARAEAEQRAEIERAKGLANADQMRLAAEHQGEIRRAAAEAKRQIAEAQNQMREAMREASQALHERLEEKRQEAAEKRRDAEEARQEAARDRADDARERARDAQQDAEERRRDKQQSYNVPDVKRIVREAMTKANVPVKVADAVSAALPAIAVNVSDRKNGVDVRVHLDD